MTSRILVVDDEPGIVDLVSYGLRREGYDVDAVGDGEAALARARDDGYDLVVLDVMLPGISGLDVCRTLRAESDVPILMLTARDAEVDTVVGLEVGADDYVTKPFSLAELVSRVRAMLRRRALDRASAAGSVVREAGGIRVDLARHEVTVDGQVVSLTPSEYRLLTLLMNEPHRVFTRREIMQHLWDSAWIADERTCDAHVSNLRRKLGPAADRIATVRGVGYKLAV
jgi:two-component system, OmpR family, response regulator RegX3